MFVLHDRRRVADDEHSGRSTTFRNGSTSACRAVGFGPSIFGIGDAATPAVTAPLRSGCSFAGDHALVVDRFDPDPSRPSRQVSRGA